MGIKIRIRPNLRVQIEKKTTWMRRQMKLKEFKSGKSITKVSPKQLPKVKRDFKSFTRVLTSLKS